MLKIKSKDEVIVIAGKDKGKRTQVQQVRSDGYLILTGVNMVKKHIKANPQKGITGGIVDKEAPIHISNVAIFNPSTQKADRVGFVLGEDGKKKRIFKSDQSEIKQST